MSEGNDREARQLIQDFDSATANRNTQQQQAIEHKLLDMAEQKFALVGLRERPLFDRLKEDRNLCAHPNFSGEAELFTPSPESVRTHIVHAVTLLLANEPLQGKAIIAIFAADVVTPAFPSNWERAVTYVRNKYLSRMRPNVAVNFADVLGKAVLGLDSDRWAVGHEQILLPALDAIARQFPQDWQGLIRNRLIALIERVPGTDVPAALRILRYFSDIMANLPDHESARLAAFIEHWKLGQRIDVFSAVDIPSLEPAVLRALGNADEKTRFLIFRTWPHHAFVEEAIKMLSGAEGWRHAESIFSNAIVPPLNEFQLSDAERLAIAVASNSQVWDAAEIPRMLTGAADQLGRAGLLRVSEPWNALRARLGSFYSASYDGLWETLAKYGVVTSAPSIWRDT